MTTTPGLATRAVARPGRLVGTLAVTQTVGHGVLSTRWLPMATIVGCIPVGQGIARLDRYGAAGYGTIAAHWQPRT